jgi:SPP1 gp7 family putative phage head morphogenesis protein
MRLGAHKADVRIAANNARKIQAALRQGVDAKRVIAAYRKTQPAESKNPTQDRARARSWAMLNMRINNEPLLEILQRTWADGFVLGQAYGDDEIKRAREAKKADTNDYIDWDNWKPGDAATATLLRPPKAFQELLGRARVTIKDLDQTGYDRVGTALADSIAQGLSDTRSARLINDAIGNPARALSIAITETNRAMSLGAISRYQAANLEQMEWATSDPCPECAMNSGAVVNIGSTFPSGANQPPAHPHCRCVLLPVIPEFEPNANGVVDIAPKPAYKPAPINQDFQYEANPDFRQKGALVTHEQDVALAAYRGNGYGSYKDINSYLRDSYPYGANRPDEVLEKVIKESIEGIDELMKIAPAAPHDFYSYRGLQGSYADVAYGLNPGQTITDLGYSSTTISKTKAVEGFTSTFSNESVILQVLNPTGTKGIMMKGYFNTDAYKESEWLLPRGTTYEVLSKTEENGVTIVKVVVK